ncbi:LysE family translocator [Marivita sp. S2033]|uniref:LysE family translocator n=1 Tax=Marivita sp. S2033 TaxID=3373187 RepID=UPI003981F1B3
MTAELLFALTGFALVTVITPGPNNLMLMTSGANFGFRRSVPHMIGVGLGFPLMVLTVGLGVMQVFDLWPGFYITLKVLSVIYMLWLAWKIANAAPPDGTPQATSSPLTFFQAAAFQWVNPKAWSMALGAITLYATGRDLAAVLWVAGAYVAMGCISTTSWTILGQQLRRILNRPKRLRVFNWTMALLLIASLIPVLTG